MWKNCQKNYQISPGNTKEFLVNTSNEIQTTLNKNTYRFLKTTERTTCWINEGDNFVEWQLLDNCVGQVPYKVTT